MFLVVFLRSRHCQGEGETYTCTGIHWHDVIQGTRNGDPSPMAEAETLYQEGSYRRVTPPCLLVQSVALHLETVLSSSDPASTLQALGAVWKEEVREEWGYLSCTTLLVLPVLNGGRKGSPSPFVTSLFAPLSLPKCACILQHHTVPPQCPSFPSLSQHRLFLKTLKVPIT